MQERFVSHVDNYRGQLKAGTGHKMLSVPFVVFKVSPGISMAPLSAVTKSLS